MLIDVLVVVIVVVDAVQSGGGVEKHRYHGLGTRRSAPQEATQPRTTRTTGRGFTSITPGV